MGFADRVRHAWQAIAHIDAQARDERGRFITEKAPARKTAALPSILSPYPRVQTALPRPTAANLRRFAETAGRPPRHQPRQGPHRQHGLADPHPPRLTTRADIPDADARINALRRALEEPNQADSFRTLFEQVLEDLLVGGFGAIEMTATGDAERPFKLYAVDGAAIQVDPRWDGDPGAPRYGFATGPLWSRRNHPRCSTANSSTCA